MVRQIDILWWFRREISGNFTRQESNKTNQELRYPLVWRQERRTRDVCRTIHQPWTRWILHLTITDLANRLSFQNYHLVRWESEGQILAADWSGATFYDETLQRSWWSHLHVRSCERNQRNWSWLWPIRQTCKLRVQRKCDATPRWE